MNQKNNMNNPFYTFDSRMSMQELLDVLSHMTSVDNAYQKCSTNANGSSGDASGNKVISDAPSHGKEAADLNGDTFSQAIENMHRNRNYRQCQDKCSEMAHDMVYRPNEPKTPRFTKTDTDKIAELEDSLSRQINETNRISSMYRQSQRTVSYLRNEIASYKAQLEKYYKILSIINEPNK